LIVVMTAPIISIGMMAGGLVPESSYDDVWFFLATRVPVLALAAVGLAIFTTNRTAGPLVLIRRAFEAVRAGDMDHRIKFRNSDKHLKNLEGAFNEMMVAIKERGEPRTGQAGVNPKAS
jgi:nitrogen fixation/metabolism regulation signal transduction histidine kinase